MTSPEERVAERLRGVAALAGPPGGEETVRRAVDRERGRRRRMLLRAAATAVLLAVAANALLTRVGDDPFPARTRASIAGLAAPSAPEAYRQPPRGSLAGDERFLADVAALDWSGPVVNGAVWDTAPGSRRVVYAADVPGGHRWAVVIGRSGVQWTYAWLAGPVGAAAAELGLAAPVERTGRGHVLALMDVSGTEAPVVVLGRPGDGAEWSSGSATDGESASSSRPLPGVDGVPVGIVPTPVGRDPGQVVLLRGGSRVDAVELVTTGQPAALPVGGDADTDVAVLLPCMTALGLQVHPDGSWSDPDLGRSSADRAAQDAAVLSCLAEADAGG